MTQPLDEVKSTLAKNLKVLANEIQEKAILIKALQEDVETKTQSFKKMMQGFLSMMPNDKHTSPKSPNGPQEQMSQELAASQAKIQEMLKSQGSQTHEAFLKAQEQAPQTPGVKTQGAKTQASQTSYTENAPNTGSTQGATKTSPSTTGG